MKHSNIGLSLFLYLSTYPISQCASRLFPLITLPLSPISFPLSYSIILTAAVTSDLSSLICDFVLCRLRVCVGGGGCTCTGHYLCWITDHIPERHMDICEVAICQSDMDSLLANSAWLLIKCPVRMWSSLSGPSRMWPSQSMAQSVCGLACLAQAVCGPVRLWSSLSGPSRAHSVWSMWFSEYITLLYPSSHPIV